MNPNDPNQTPTPQQPPQPGGFVETPPPQTPQPYQPPTQYQSPPQAPTHDQYSVIPPVGGGSPENTPPPRELPQQEMTPPPRPKSYDKVPLPFRILDWFKSHWYAPVIAIIGLVILGDLIYQFAYPMSAMPHGLKVDGVNIGGISKEEAAKKLDDVYAKVDVDIFFGSSTIPYQTPTAKEVGIQIHNESRLKDVSYPVWLRFVPTSMMWAKDLVEVGQPVYDHDSSTVDTYTLNNVGQDCYIDPKNASLKLDDGKFAVIPSQPGGKCDINDFKDAIKEARIKDGKFVVRTSMNEIDAPITDEIARQLGDDLNHNLADDKKLQAGGKTETLPSMAIKGWLSFKPIIPEPKEDGSTPLPPRLTYVIEPDRVRKYFDGTIYSRVEKEPGVTKISTTNFKETSHSKGKSGTKIDMDKTIKSIDSVVQMRSNTAKVTTKLVGPTTEYNRKYTPTAEGYMALARQFGSDNGGHFGIKFQELSGKKPYLGGSYRANQSFPTAGLEGIYLAYAAQAEIEDGSIQPTDRIAGSTSVEDCIPIAITEQDEDCIDALLNKVGNSVVMQRMKQIGLNSTDFTKKTITTTANDLYKFMYKLEEKELRISKYGDIESPMRDIDERYGFIAGTESNSPYSVVGSSGGYNEAMNTSKNGRYIVVMLSKQDNPELAKKFMEAVEKIHQQKRDL